MASMFSSCTPCTHCENVIVYPKPFSKLFIQKISRAHNKIYLIISIIEYGIYVKSIYYITNMYIVYE